MVLGLSGVGVAVKGSGIRVRLELREGVEESVEVLVHTPACLDREDRDLLILSAAKRGVVLPLLGCSVLEHRACLLVAPYLGVRVLLSIPKTAR